MSKEPTLLEDLTACADDDTENSCDCGETLCPGAQLKARAARLRDHARRLREEMEESRIIAENDADPDVVEIAASRLNAAIRINGGGPTHGE